jgi:hypothetical protein
MNRKKGHIEYPETLAFRTQTGKKEEIQTYCENKGISKSDLLRRLINKFLTEKSNNHEVRRD